jgi:hypothetical protein
MSAMPSLRAAAEHHRIDAALSLPGGYALRAGVFRRNATQWREEQLYRGLKVIMLDGQVHSRIEDRSPLLLHGPTLVLAWNTGQVQGADAFAAGVDQRYAMVSLPGTALWQELGVDPDVFRRLAPGQSAAEPVVWHGPAGRDARRIADQVRVCAYDGAARNLFMPPRGWNWQRWPWRRRRNRAPCRPDPAAPKQARPANWTRRTRPAAACWPICASRQPRQSWRADSACTRASWNRPSSASSASAWRAACRKRGWSTAGT